MVQNSMSAPPYAAATARIPSHIVLAILSVFFFTPAGALAVYYAARVGRLVAAGDAAGAHAASRKAKVYALISLGLGAAFILFCLLAVLAFALFGAAHRTH